uniref:Uncharacterized protein n=1 Tax=Rhizophora mucronata TaxID=61149 RepID=A0A2P2NS01_RHIMU
MEIHDTTYSEIGCRKQDTSKVTI